MDVPYQHRFSNEAHLLKSSGEETGPSLTEPALYNKHARLRNKNARLGSHSIQKLTNKDDTKGRIHTGSMTVTQPQAPLPAAPLDFARVLLKHANSTSKEVVLSIVDATYSDFGLNFYETSIVQFGIQNFLMVCLDTAAQSWLARHNVSCYYFATSFFESDAGSSRGDFGTAGYYLKTNLKTLVMLHALDAGFTVLLVDLDIVFLKNPLRYLTCGDCDIQIQQDRVHLNSGFVYARSTRASRLLYETAWRKYRHYRKSHDQAYINMAVAIFENEKTKIKIERLSPSLFPCGAFYFTTPTFWRMFGTDPCEKCVIVHNNYIGSTAAKRYRFKENELWSVDEDGYYSDPRARYITYSNPAFFGAHTGAMEREALRNALAIGNITGRVVILPHFHCCECERNACKESRQKCSLLTVLKVRTFDEAFKGKYREHSFLKNPKVPEVFKSFIATDNRRTFRIKGRVYKNTTDIPPKGNVVDLLPSTPGEGATASEIREWFRPYGDDPVLVFHSLYGAFSDFPDPATARDFHSRVSRGFECTSYDQWEVKDKW